MQRLILLLLVCVYQATTAQELFVFTEPASNMAAKGIGVRANNYLMFNNTTNKANYHLVPELMWGASKKLMFHAEAFLSNRNQRFIAEGGGGYMKYRFYTTDEVHSHFRMAVYGRYSFNNSDVHQQAIDLNGHNSGYEAGLITTKLVNKVAISASAAFVHATDNGKEKFTFGNAKRNAINYTASAGKLMLPKEYSGYKQTNLNLMLEMLGQLNTGSGYSFLDMAPSVQLIFLSRMRFDAGYRIPLVKDLGRTTPGGFLFRFEYNIFNAY